MNKKIIKTLINLNYLNEIKDDDEQKKMIELFFKDKKKMN